MARPLNHTGERMREAANDVAEQTVPQLQPLLDYKLLNLSGATVTVGGVLTALVILLLGWLASSLVRTALRRFGERNPKTNSAALYTLSRVAHYLVLLIAVMVALDVVGIPLGKFTVFAGAIGVGLGFGLQAIFSNFISGLILLFDRSLKVGDFIQLDDGTRGVVKAINIRSTRVTTNDNIDVLVPNEQFIKGRVTNWTHRSVNRRIRVPFGVAYGIDKELVKKAALEACANVPFTLAMDGDKAPQVWLTGFGENAVQFVLAVWTTEAAARRNSAVSAAYLWELDTSFRRHGVELPFAQRDLHVRTLFGLRDGAALQALLQHAPTRQGSDPELLATAQSLQADASGPAPLSDHERAHLSRNDAQLDAQREIAAEPEHGDASHADHRDNRPDRESAS